MEELAAEVTLGHVNKHVFMESHSEYGGHVSSLHIVCLAAVDVIVVAFVATGASVVVAFVAVWVGTTVVVALVAATVVVVASVGERVVVVAFVVAIVVFAVAVALLSWHRQVPAMTRIRKILAD